MPPSKYVSALATNAFVTAPFGPIVIEVVSNPPKPEAAFTPYWSVLTEDTV